MNKYVALIAFLGFTMVPTLASAYEINYASTDRIAGDTILLKYRTTEGYTFAECTFSGKCGDRLFGEYVNSNAPSLFPEILNSIDYTKSVDGTLAVVPFAALNGSVYRSLYSIDDGTAHFKTLIPYREPAVRTSISYADDAVVFVGVNGDIARYDIASRTLKSAQSGQTSFPFWSLSEHGNYVASYDYTTKTQNVLNIATGEKTNFSATTNAYAVFSDDEHTLAYLNEVDGFNKLFISALNNPNLARDIDPGNYTVVEYEFVGNNLYYIANTENNPYTWNLYSYNSSTGIRNTVDTDVAYDDGYSSLKKTHTALLYEKVDGANKDVLVYTPATAKSVVLRARDVQERETSETITRENVSVGGVPGVLLAPKNSRGAPALIVWLHGGPARQASIGYHPFMGYAVYDEILERFAQEAYVLKLDYTGSWGHGVEYREALKNHIGERDVKDVLSAIDGIKKDKNISNVYLFGPSYGGYLALRTLVEAPKEIDSVVSIAGVTDWMSLTTRIPSSPFTSQFSGTPNALNISQYMTASIQSRLGALDNQKMLLIYGEDDDTVPVWQSKEFFTLAKMIGKNVELVPYAGEGHTILKKEDLRDVCVRSAKVFDLSTSVCGK